jgi:RNA polymerase sigma-70 factor (ECF subfamily)
VTAPPGDPDARGRPARDERGPLDRDEVERLYRAHGHLVLRRAAMLLGNQADAQEALQEVFAALLRSPGEVRQAGSVVAWLYRATTHHCLNALRHRRTGARLVERHLAPSGAEPPGHAPDALHRADALAEVRRLLALLPDEEGAAVVYHHLDGMTYDEVAGQLGCSRRKVGYLLERAQGLMERERAERIA